jgi:hypothetical protein
MRSSTIEALTKLIPKYALFKTFIIGLLVLSLTACSGKAASQDISIQLSEKPVQQKNAQLSRKISEVAPPEVIQELRQSLEVYQPQVKILNPQPDQVLQTDKLKVNLQVKDLPIFKNVQYGLGSHLKVILDNQPGLEIYDLNQPLELSDLSPGTHTLRVFASRAWHESFKNEGAYAQTTFHVFTKSDDNNPDTNLPILTYNHPQGSYGAEPILLDFYLTNAPLHILAKDNPDSAIADWRIRCTINGESFIIDRWQSLYLKGFKSGQNWVKLEFLDNQGDPVKNAFNSTVRVINYEAKGKDTLAKIVRGELSAQDLRGIVDSDYVVEIPAEESAKKKVEEELDNGGFFDRFKRDKEDKIPTPQPTLEPIPEVIKTPTPENAEPIPEIIETPTPETNLDETIPEVTETPTPETTPFPTEDYLLKNRRDALSAEKRGKQKSVILEGERSSLQETVPEVIEIPELQTNTEATPEAEIVPIPQPESKPEGFFNRFKPGKKDKTSTPQPTVETNPEVIENPTPEVIPESGDVEPKIEFTPELPTTTLPEIVEPLESESSVTQPEAQIEITPEAKQSTTKKLGEYFNLPRRTIPVPTPDIEVPSVPVIQQPNGELVN